MPDAKPYQEQGLIPDRYRVQKGDGSPLDPEAKVFVLRYDKNDTWGRCCRLALYKLADELMFEYPKLAVDLRRELAGAMAEDIAAHLEHGRGTAEDGPDDPACGCTGHPQQATCAQAGCGFCIAASTKAGHE